MVSLRQKVSVEVSIPSIGIDKVSVARAILVSIPVSVVSETTLALLTHCAFEAL